MKVRIEIDVPDDTTAREVQGLFSEFSWLAKARGWRTLISLPKVKKPLKKPEQAQG